MRTTVTLISVAVAVALGAESYLYKRHLRERQAVIEAFLGKKDGAGVSLRDRIRPDSLAVFPISETQGLACGVVPIARSQSPVPPEGLRVLPGQTQKIVE